MDIKLLKARQVELFLAQQLVKKTINMMGKEFIDKCFWSKDQHEVYRLYDRVTPTATTYNKKDSDSGWKHTWYL